MEHAGGLPSQKLVMCRTKQNIMLFPSINFGHPAFSPAGGMCTSSAIRAFYKLK